MNSAPATTISDDLSIDDTADQAVPASDDLVEDELLVEEISIDGMCGVY
jgi:mycofactocin precursor